MDLREVFYNQGEYKPRGGLTVAELKDMCRKLGLLVSGSKKELYDRLDSHFKTDRKVYDVPKKRSVTVDLESVGNDLMRLSVNDKAPKEERTLFIHLPDYSKLGVDDIKFSSDAKKIVDKIMLGIINYLIDLDMSIDKMSRFLDKKYGSDVEYMLDSAHLEEKNKTNPKIVNHELSHYITGFVYEAVALLKEYPGPMVVGMGSKMASKDFDERSNMYIITLDTVKRNILENSFFTDICKTL